MDLWWPPEQRSDHQRTVDGRDNHPRLNAAEEPSAKTLMVIRDGHPWRPRRVGMNPMAGQRRRKDPVLGLENSGHRCPPEYLRVDRASDTTYPPSVSDGRLCA